MSMVTYPLNNIEYTAEDAELFHSTRTSGVYATDSFDYSVTGADNSIVIGTGIAWIKNRQFSGKVVAQKEPMSLDMGLPDPTYPRIDAVVIQFNSNKNATEIVVKNGAASSFPIAPEVVRTESLYELHLYHVRREAGSLSISAPNITDLRNNNAYCGLMSDSITQAVDSTLSKNGVAADAAAVGTALSEKAPAGYGGYGEVTEKVLCSTNAALFAALDNKLAQLPYGSGIRLTISSMEQPLKDYHYSGVLQNFESGIAVFEGISYGLKSNGVREALKVVISKNNDNWVIECVNPPMELDVEYRTIERWNGKAVYTKLVNCEALPNATTKEVAHGATVTQIIRCMGQSITNKTPIPRMYGNHIYMFADDVYIYITTTDDYSDQHAYAQIWYTKD